MATYIADSGSQSLFASLTGTFTTDEANKVITYGSDGEADTGYTLPNGIAWLLIEVYDVEGVAGDVGYTLFKTKVRNYTTTMSTAQTLADNEHTTYKIAATYYKGDETCDVYHGDESTTLALASEHTGMDFVPSTSSWKITDTVIAPDMVNLVIDPAPDDSTYWTGIDGTYTTISNGSVTLDSASSGTSERAYANLSESLETDGWYVVGCKCTSRTGGAYRFYVGNSWDGNYYYTVSSTVTVESDPTQWDNSINSVSIHILMVATTIVTTDFVCYHVDAP